MKKNGFTLIELLAVIVILAIIALIATPIILGIINDAKEESNERSVELYASAVRNGIVAYQLREGKEVEAKKYTKDTLPFKVEYDGNVVCDTVEISEEGNVSLEGCKVNNGTKKYSYGIKQGSNVAKVCSIAKQNASKYSKGDVVTCNIGDEPDKFYVIEDAELSATTIKMLTEKNIHTTEYRQSDDAGIVMFGLTNNWEAPYPADVYNDSNDIIKPIVDKYVGYLNTKLIGTTGSLLTYSQAVNLGCSGSEYSCSSAPSWLYSTTYWTGSAASYEYVYLVDSLGDFSGDHYACGVGCYGVRPVITISTTEIGAA